MHSLYWYTCLTGIAPSTSPTNFGGGVENATAITLFCGPPLPEDTNGEITGYIINITSTEASEILYLTADITHQTLTSLKPFTIYSITIAAQTAVGIGPVSQTLMLKTREGGESIIAIIVYVYVVYIILIHVQNPKGNVGLHA